jgi:hypothetical protein
MLFCVVRESTNLGFLKEIFQEVNTENIVWVLPRIHEFIFILGIVPLNCYHCEGFFLDDCGNLYFFEVPFKIDGLLKSKDCRARSSLSTT